MSKRKRYKLLYDPDFELLVQPMSDERKSEMRDRYLEKRQIQPIRTWKGCILVEFAKYELYESLGIPYKIRELEFADKNEAIIWICENQLKREDICLSMRKYLIGRLYSAEKNRCISVKNGKGMDKDHPIGQEYASDMIVRLSKTYNRTDTSIRVSSREAKYLDQLGQRIPEFRKSVIYGDIRFGYDNLRYMAKLDFETAVDLCEYLLSHPDKKYRSALKEVNENKDAAKKESVEDMSQQRGNITVYQQAKGTVKDMPVYDPDAEISSLALTIPSWGSSIQRVRNTANFEGASPEAKRRLRKNLMQLGTATFEMMCLLEVE